MAKLNTQKLVASSRAQTRREHTCYSDLELRHDTLLRQDFEATGRWSVPGKHFGKPMKELPNQYLFWIIENFQDGKHRQRAEHEIYQRYYQTSDTQG